MEDAREEEALSYKIEDSPQTSLSKLKAVLLKYIFALVSLELACTQALLLGNSIQRDVLLHSAVNARGIGTRSP